MSKNHQTAALDGIVDLAFWYKNNQLSSAIIDILENLNPKAKPLKDITAFYKFFVERSIENDTSGDEMIIQANNELREADNQKGGAIYLLAIALAYYSEALKSDDIQVGWRAVSEGKYWSGRLIGITEENNFHQRMSNAKASEVRHSKSNDLKQFFISEWYPKHANSFSTQLALLLTFQEKYEVSHRTSERWVSEIKKGKR